jgi:hypothetical protein
MGPRGGGDAKGTQSGVSLWLGHSDKESAALSRWRQPGEGEERHVRPRPIQTVRIWQPGPALSDPRFRRQARTRQHVNRNSEFDSITTAHNECPSGGQENKTRDATDS